VQSDVLNLSQAPGVTFVTDLAEGHNLPAESFDCIVLTQTLHLVHDFQAAVRTLHRILKPSGVLLLTAPGISQIARGHGWEDQWRFTSASARSVFGQVFGQENVSVEAQGNVLASTAFLYGLADHELSRSELDYHDPDYELILLVRAVRAR
jgi:SAM-dependent methyltransferase